MSAEPLWHRMTPAGAPSLRLPRPRTLLALVLLLCLGGVAAFPGLVSGAGPDATDVFASLRPPSALHPFGTDELGRDVFARVVHGARLSLVIGCLAALLGAVGGTLLGLLGALGGRAVDQVLMRACDILLAFPELLTALLVITIVGHGTGNVVLSLAVASAPAYARLVRAQAQVVLQAEYVESGTALGLSRAVQMRRHVLPHVLLPLLPVVTTGAGSAIVAGSALSYLGMGPQPPAPEWGAMLADGQDDLQTAWWTAVFPGLAICCAVMLLTLVGRGLARNLPGGER